MLNTKKCALLSLSGEPTGHQDKKRKLTDHEKVTLVFGRMKESI